MRYFILFSTLFLMATASANANPATPLLLAAAHNDMKPNKYTGIDAMLVYQDGKLINENYYGRFTQATKHRTHSTFKSINALIALIAIDKELLSENELVFPLLEKFRKLEDTDPRKRQITVSHLLNMTSGLACNEAPGSDGPNHEAGVDEGETPLAYSMEIEMATTPGTTFHYCNANSFLLAATVSAALERADRENIFQFATENLMTPLGITDFRFTTSYDGNFLNGQGNSYFRPYDLAKLGQLVLQHGAWEGKQLISSNLVERLFEPLQEVNWTFTDLVEGMPATASTYSHQWYTTTFQLSSGQNIAVTHSWGNGGQYIYVVPELEAVVVFTGSNQGNFTKQKQPFDIMRNYVLPELAHFTK